MNPIDKALADHLAHTPLARQAMAAIDEDGVRDWFRFRAQADGADAVDVYVYGVIGGWWSGVNADEFVRELRGINAKRINVHIASPGGSIFDGLAIYQALRNHKARIETYVDSLAASAASVIAMAGDRRHSAPYASMMVHKAWGIAIGNDDDMEKARDDLARICRTMAGLYADRAGGDADDWLETMTAETWYTATEALDAGLVHEVQEDAEKTEENGDESDTNAAWDLTIYAYAGRNNAPAPRMPNTAARAPQPRTGPEPAAKPEDVPAAEPETTEPTKEDPVSTLNADVRARLGLPDDSTDDAVLAALDEVKAKAEAPRADPDAEAVLAAQAAENADLTEKVAMLTEQMQTFAAQLAAANAEKAATVKAAVLDAAQAKGKFAVADRAAWEARYDKAPEVTADILNAIPDSTAVPTALVGTSGGLNLDDEADWDEALARLDGPTNTTKGA